MVPDQLAPTLFYSSIKPTESSPETAPESEPEVDFKTKYPNLEEEMKKYIHSLLTGTPYVTTPAPDPENPKIELNLESDQTGPEEIVPEGDQQEPETEQGGDLESVSESEQEVPAEEELPPESDPEINTDAEEVSSDNDSPVDYESEQSQNGFEESESDTESEAEERFFRKLLTKSDRISDDSRFSEFKVKFPKSFKGFTDWKIFA